MIRPGAEWRELTRMPMVKGSQSDSEDRDVFTRLFLDYVKTQPADFAKGLVEKTVQFFSSRELPRNDDLYVARRYSTAAFRSDLEGGRDSDFPSGCFCRSRSWGSCGTAKRIPVPVCTVPPSVSRGDHRRIRVGAVPDPDRSDTRGSRRGRRAVSRRSLRGEAMVRARRRSRERYAPSPRRRASRARSRSSGSITRPRCTRSSASSS